jgi:N-acetyl-anhydromuramyl-L-alanine amidase AmpD
MLAIEMDPAKRQDYTPGRRNTPIDTIVLHTTEGGSIEGAADWWDREDVVASAHFIIDGRRVVQRVCEGDTAYHAGNAAMNRRSIGIEVVGHCDHRETWTREVLEQLAELVAELVRRHRIEVKHQPGPGICGHCDVPDPHHPDLRGGASHHRDPGGHFPWGELLARVRARLVEDLT